MAEKKPVRNNVELTDPRALRAYAHPTRMALVGLLRREGPCTATRAAELTGESVASCSYHLRILAKYGLAEEDDPGGPGREKPWRATADSTDWPNWSEDPAVAEAAQALTLAVAENWFHRLTRALERHDQVPREWQEAERFSDTTLYLTPGELADLGERMDAAPRAVRRPRQEPAGAARGRPPRAVPPDRLRRTRTRPEPPGGPAAGEGRMRAPAVRRAVGARVPSLLRERPFRRYWTGQAVSRFGDQVTFLALPLAAVLVLHADAAQMGWLSMAALLPALLFSLPAGAWADRRGRRRRTMIAADLARAALMASIPLAYALGGLTLAQLYAVAFMVGTLAVVFDVCNATLFVSLVEPERYVEGNSLTNGSSAFSFVAGPSAGGLLVQVLAAPFALLADAVSYVFSAGLLARIAPAEPPAAERGKGHFSAGLRFVARSPTLRALVAAAATVNFFNFIFHTLVVLYAVGELGLDAGTLGIVVGAGAVGGIIGAVFTGRVVRRARHRPDGAARLRRLPRAAGPGAAGGRAQGAGAGGVLRLGVPAPASG